MLSSIQPPKDARDERIEQLEEQLKQMEEQKQQLLTKHQQIVDDHALAREARRARKRQRTEARRANQFAKMKAQERLEYLFAGSQTVAQRIKSGIIFSPEAYTEHRPVLPDQGGVHCPVYVARQELNRIVSDSLDELDVCVMRFRHCIDPVFELAAKAILKIIEHDDIVGADFKSKEIEAVLCMIQTLFGTLSGSQ